MKRRGFTLIELLVIIAIIGILSAVVFVSLGSARTKSSDTTTKEELDQALSRIEQYYEDNGNYGATLVDANCITSAGSSIFATDPQLVAIIAKIASSNGGVTPHCATGVASGSGAATSWAIYATLKGSAVGAAPWCVDSNQFRGAMAFGGEGVKLGIFAPLFNIAYAVPVYWLYGGTVPAKCQ